MKKFLLAAALAVVCSANAMAIDVKWHVNESGQVPVGVQKFLQTPVGKNFTAQQVMNATQGPRRVEVGPNVQVNTLLAEDFSKFTAGTEEAPDATDIMMLENADDFFFTPGWTGVEVYQAGGKAYLGLGVADDGSDNPGYLFSPNVNLAQGQGIYRVKFRIRNANENAVGQGMQYFVLDNNPENPGMILANTLPMSNDEYTDVEFIGANGREYTSFMFFSWKGKMFIDGMSVEELTFPLESPKNIQMEVVSGNELKVTWDAVEGANLYSVVLIQGDTEVAKMDVETNEAVLMGNFTPEETVNVEVVARNGDDNSYPGYAYVKPTVNAVGTPVALEATDVTEDGFTANWEKADFAANYSLFVNRTHEVTEEGEMMIYMQEDFQEIPYESTDDQNSTIITTTGAPVLLDDILNYPGWSVFLAAAVKGMLAITNMYEIYGIPGVLIGPAADYSYGGGKVDVSGIALTLVDDAVVKVGFGELTINPATMSYMVQYDEGAQEVEISQMGTMFNVQIEGGAPNKRIIFQMTDGAEGGDMVAFMALNLTTQLAIGDTYTALFERATLPADVLSYRVEAPMNSNDVYEYYVVGSFGSVKSGNSNVITVKNEDEGIMTIGGNDNVNMRIVDGQLIVDNPERAEVTVYSANGAQVARTSTDNSVKVALGNGAYIVRIGNKAFKVVR